MNNFKKKLFGYSISEVERHFTKLEYEHKTIISQKETELKLINKKINELSTTNNSLAQELDIINKKKDDFVSYVNNGLEKIETFVNSKQTESTEIKQAAIKKLTLKRNELTKAQNSIKEFKKDLSYIKNRRRLAGELFNL